MDPSSIVSAATAAAKGAWEIYSLCHDAKHVNQTVRGLGKEARAVGDACETVARRLEGILDEADATKSPSDKMRQLLGTRITDCQETVTQLKSSLQGLDNESLNFLEKLGKQIRLNLRAADISEARSQLRSHIDGLQLILHVLSIEISYLLPRKADQYLCTLIAKVEQRVEQMELMQTQDKMATFSGQEELLTYSKKATSNADDLYRESQANGSVGPAPTEERIREIEGWVQEVSDSAPLQDNNIEQDQMSFSSGDRTLVGDEQRVRRSRKSVIDVSFQLLLANAALKAARSSFDAHNFKECISHLQERSKLVGSLPEAETIKCNREESDFRLEIALEALRAGRAAFDESGFAAAQTHFCDAVELVGPLPEDLQTKYKAEKSKLRVELATVSLESARNSFAAGNFADSTSRLHEFAQFAEFLDGDSLAQVQQKEISMRISTARDALEAAQLAFEKGDCDTCWGILQARLDLVSVLPEPEKTECINQEYQLRETFARKSLESAHKAVAADEYESCIHHLQLRDTILKPVPSRQPDDIDILRPVYCHALYLCGTASAKTQDERTAIRIAALLKAVDVYEAKIPDLTDQLQVDFYSLCYTLSQQYVKASDMDEAQHYCGVALTGYRKTLGDSHEHSSSCLALMARVLELKGENMSAHYHKTLIPPEHLDHSLVRQMLALPVKSVRFEEGSAPQPPANEQGQPVQLSERNLEPSLPTQSMDLIKSSKRSSQLVLPGVAQQVAVKVSDTVTDGEKQLILASSVLSTGGSHLSPPVAGKSPSSVILHCEFGRVIIRKDIKVTSVAATAEWSYRAIQDAEKRWERLVQSTKGLAAKTNWKIYPSAAFTKHTSGKGHLSYVPAIDLYVNEFAGSTTTHLSLTPGHARILSAQPIQWAHVGGGVETDKVLKKIDAAVSGGMLKKSRVVLITKAEHQ